jgi:hypothetical protein
MYRPTFFRIPLFKNKIKNSKKFYETKLAMWKSIHGSKNWNLVEIFARVDRAVHRLQDPVGDPDALRRRADVHGLLEVVTLARIPLHRSASGDGQHERHGQHRGGVHFHCVVVVVGSAAAFVVIVIDDVIIVIVVGAAAVVVAVSQ